MHAARDSPSSTGATPSPSNRRPGPRRDAGPTWLRLLHSNGRTVLDDGSFVQGGAAELRTGDDVVLTAAGPTTLRALQAAARLEADSVDVAVLHIATRAAGHRGDHRRGTGPDRLLVASEHHAVVGGLTESVAGRLPIGAVGERGIDEATARALAAGWQRMGGPRPRRACRGLRAKSPRQPASRRPGCAATSPPASGGLDAAGEGELPAGVPEGARAVSPT